MTADELLKLVADYGEACVNVGYCTEEPISADPEASGLQARIETEVRRLHGELDGNKKVIDLLLKGMESQCELMDELKQKARKE